MSQWDDIENRGYSEIDGLLCLSHVTDLGLSAAVQPYAVEGECLFCGRQDARQELVVPLEKVQQEVMEALWFYYESPENAEVPWDGGWQGATVIDSPDAIESICFDAFDEKVEEGVKKALSDAIFGLEWTDNRHGASLDAALWAWDQFVEDVTAESRFVFWPDLKEEELNGSSVPGRRSAQFLWSLLPYIENSDLDLLVKVPAGSEFYRGRLVDDISNQMRTAKDLGPAPAEYAAANRMSPEGVPMFYGSASPETAIREIAAHGNGRYARVGAFRNQRELTLLDLTREVVYPSLFDKSSRDSSGIVRFFRSFSENVTAPLTPDRRPHMQYIPTQVVTEFFRWVPRIKIDGIKLTSAQDQNHTYLLFCDHRQVSDKVEKVPNEDLSGTQTGESQRVFLNFLPVLEEELVLTLDPNEVKTYKVIRQVDAEPVRDFWYTESSVASSSISRPVPAE